MVAVEAACMHLSTAALVGGLTTICRSAAFPAHRLLRNGWGCRCDVQAIAGTAARVEPKGLPGVKDVPPVFRHNPGLTGEIFSKEHPYFQGFSKEEAKKVLAAMDKIRFDDLDEKDYYNSSQRLPAALSPFKNMLGYYPNTGSFMAVHKGHIMDNLADEMPACKILVENGTSVILLDESKVPRYDIEVGGERYDLKRLHSFENIVTRMHTLFRKAKKKSPPIDSLMLHIDKALSDQELSKALKNAAMQSKSINKVKLLWNNVK